MGCSLLLRSSHDPVHGIFPLVCDILILLRASTLPLAAAELGRLPASQNRMALGIRTHPPLRYSKLKREGAKMDISTTQFAPKRGWF